MPPFGILLSDDLIFTSRITGAARAHGLDMCAVSALATLEEMSRQRPPACVVVDLHFPGLMIAELVPTLKQLGPCTIVGYGSHVAAELLRHARDAGCDVVLPRSKFVEVLETEIATWYGMRSANPQSH